MGMPATRLRKAKPVAMWRAARFAEVLRIKYQAIAATMPTMTICQTTARKAGSVQDSRMRRLGAARGATRRGSAVAWDIVRRSPTQLARQNPGHIGAQGCFSQRAFERR